MAIKPHTAHSPSITWHEQKRRAQFFSVTLLMLLSLRQVSPVTASGFSEEYIYIPQSADLFPLLTTKKPSVFHPHTPTYWFQGSGVVLDRETMSPCQPGLERATLVPLMDHKVWQLFIVFDRGTCGIITEATLELFAVNKSDLELTDPKKSVFIFSATTHRWEAQLYTDSAVPEIVFQNETEMILHIPFDLLAANDTLLWALHLFTTEQGLIDRLPNTGIVLPEKEPLPSSTPFISGLPSPETTLLPSHPPFIFGKQQRVATLLLGLVVFVSLLSFLLTHASDKKRKRQLAKPTPKA